MTTFQKIIKYCAVAFAVFIIASIITGFLSVLKIFSFISDSKNTVGEMKAFDVSGNVKNLEVEISAADFEIKEGNAFRVESNYKNLKVEEKSGALKITEKKKPFSISVKDIKLIIYLPKGLVFEKADITSGVGKLSFEKLSAQKLVLDFGVGKAVINELEALDSATINGGAGFVEIRNGWLNNLTLDMGVGKFKLKSKLTGKSDIDHGIGNGEIILLGSKEDYSLDIDKGLGQTTVDGEKIEDDTTFGTGNNRVEIDGGIGEINIKFENAED